MRQHSVLGVCAAGLLLATAAGSTVVHARMVQVVTVQPPVVGEVARDFTLNRIDGTPVSLTTLRTSGPVVVLMLRGWVGYQ
jgi:hypothetical protein